MLEVRLREIRSSLASLVTPAIVEEHRRQPTGHHSPALALVLSFFRQAPVESKWAVYASVPGRQWQVVRLSGVPGVPPDDGDPARFASEDAASHEIFLRRLEEFGPRPPARDG